MSQNVEGRKKNFRIKKQSGVELHRQYQKRGLGEDQTGLFPEENFIHAQCFFRFIESKFRHYITGNGLEQ